MKCLWPAKEWAKCLRWQPHLCKSLICNSSLYSHVNTNVGYYSYWLTEVQLYVFMSLCYVQLCITQFFPANTLKLAKTDCTEAWETHIQHFYDYTHTDDTAHTFILCMDISGMMKKALGHKIIALPCTWQIPKETQTDRYMQGLFILSNVHFLSPLQISTQTHENYSCITS